MQLPARSFVWASARLELVGLTKHGEFRLLTSWSPARAATIFFQLLRSGDVVPVMLAPESVQASDKSECNWIAGGKEKTIGIDAVKPL